MKKYKIEYVVVVEDADADLQTIGNLLTANDEIWSGKTLKPVANGNQLAGLVIDADSEEDIIRIQQIAEGKFGLMGEATTSEDAVRAGKVDGGDGDDGKEVANNADGSPEEEEVPQTAYIITTKNENVEKAEFLRFYIASKLRERYASSIHLFLTRDDVSARHATAIYPLLHDVENKIRGFLTHFFVPLAGPKWLHQTASKKMQHTVLTRRSVQMDRSWKWSRLLDDHLHFMDFHELGKLITTQSFGMNEPEQILERLEDIADWESFQSLKKELQSNYSRYFDDSFRENNFRKTWGHLVDIRHRVAHNSLLTEKDVSMANRLVGLVKTILNEAKNNQREELGGADSGGQVDTGGDLGAGISGVEGSVPEVSGAEVDSMGERFVVPKGSDRSDVEGDGVEMDQSTGEVRSGEVNEQLNEQEHGQGVAETPSDSPPLMEQDYSDLMPKLNILGKVNIESRGRIQPRRGTVVQGVQEAEGAQDVQGAKDTQGVYDSQDAKDAQDAKDTQESQNGVPNYGGRGRDHGGNTRIAEPQSESDEDELPWIIEREEILDALEEFQNDPRYSESRYLAFSTFQKLLVEEGYEKSSIRRLAFEMAAEEDSRVQIYTYHDLQKNYDVTSIKLLDGDLKGEG